VLCDNFTKYQRWTEDGEYEIVPRPKQKEFLKRIICSETPMHFSEVGSGKTKVIMPLLCQIFLSNNADAHKFLARSGMPKTVLILVVPEHLVADARTQVMRYCLNLNFRQEYRVYDDIFALLHQNVKLGSMKQIFVTSFNQFKKSLTVDSIAKKVYPHREHILVVADEVDDFLGT
jgi:superfamily II DNA or RNA helicase